MPQMSTRPSREMYESEMQRVRPSGPKVPYEVAKQFVEKERYIIKFPHGYHMGHELNTIREIVFPLFSRMQWSLLLAEAGRSNFVSSDRLAVLFEIIDPPHQRHYSNTPTKPIVKDLELTMPLNLRMALYATFGDPSVSATAAKGTLRLSMGERYMLLQDRFTVQTLISNFWTIER